MTTGPGAAPDYNEGTMANIPSDLRYTRDHEWAKRENGNVRVGITHYAQEQLGDVVFVELPKVGKLRQSRSTPQASPNSNCPVGANGFLFAQPSVNCLPF